MITNACNHGGRRNVRMPRDGLELTILGNKLMPLQILALVFASRSLFVYALI